MNLSFSTLACPLWSLGQILEAAEEHRIPGIDFRGLLHDIDITKLPIFSSEFDATFSDMKRRGLSMPCLNTSITLVTPASERWQMMLDECARYAQLAERAGTKYLRIFGGAIPKTMSSGEGLMLAQRHLKQLAKICRQHNCMPLLETHDEWSTAPQIQPLLSDISPQDAGVLWDLEHPYRQGEAPNYTFSALGPRILHVHIKDALVIDGKYVPKLLGDGDLPLKEMLSILRTGNFNGWICLESEKRWHPEAPGPEVSLPQFAQFMRENWA